MHPPSILEVDESAEIFPPTSFMDYCTTKKVQDLENHKGHNAMKILMQDGEHKNIVQTV